MFAALVQICAVRFIKDLPLKVLRSPFNVMPKAAPSSSRVSPSGRP